MEVRELKNPYEKGNNQEFLDQYNQLEKQNLLGTKTLQELIIAMLPLRQRKKTT